MGLKEFIRERARESGFGAVGFARAGKVPGDRLREWLRRGYQGGMDYLARAPERRLDPALLLPGARTVASFLHPYPHRLRPGADDPGAGIVARYARGRDYHLVLEKKLKKMLGEIRSEYPGSGGRCYVDSGPVSETWWAWKAGLGWIGRNSLLISREFGSWFFLAEILLEAEVEPDSPSPDFCRTCRACIEACPTSAIVEPGIVDARRCISYLTIEHRSAIPPALAEKMGRRIFGCDACQEVCPWNRGVPEPDDPLLAPVPRDYSLSRLAGLELEEFNDLFRQSPLKRAGLEGFRRNVAAAMSNRNQQARSIGETERNLV